MSLQFDQWSRAVTTRNDIAAALKGHVLECKRCHAFGRINCPTARLLINDHKRAQATVEQYSGPFGNPNITRYG